MTEISFYTKFLLLLPHFVTVVAAANSVTLLQFRGDLNFSDRVAWWLFHWRIILLLHLHQHIITGLRNLVCISIPLHLWIRCLQTWVRCSSLVLETTHSVQASRHQGWALVRLLLHIQVRACHTSLRCVFLRACWFFVLFCFECEVRWSVCHNLRFKVWFSRRIICLISLRDGTSTYPVLIWICFNVLQLSHRVCKLVFCWGNRFSSRNGWGFCNCHFWYFIICFRSWI